MKRSNSKSMASCASAPFFGASALNIYSARQPSCVTCQGSSASAMALATPRVQRSAIGIMRSKASFVSTLLKVARMARERTSDPAYVAVLQVVFVFGRDAVGNVLRETIGRARNASANSLAKDKHVGFEVFGPRVTARASADGMRLIDNQQRAVLAAEFPESVMISRRGMHDADIGHRRF